MCLTFYLVYPVILGIFAIKKLDNAKSTSELKTWGILSMFFVSTLGGIFMLCVRDDELSENVVLVNNSSGYDRAYDPSEKLIELKQLFDEGVIDESVYNEKRKKYLEDL